uniref:Transposase n=1 Tax=Streptomyces sp. NBC_00093 TaxID=2975649 RepID=A0AAU2AID9_9ACTN
MTTTFHVTNCAIRPMDGREEATHARIFLVQTHIHRISGGETAIDVPVPSGGRSHDPDLPASLRRGQLRSHARSRLPGGLGRPLAPPRRARGLLDDAAMVWKRLPDSWQVPGAEQVKGEPPSQNSQRLAGCMTLIGADTADFDAARPG